MNRHALALCAAAFAVLGAAQFGLAADPPKTTVGMFGTFRDLVLPGSELEPIPVADDRQPVILRIAASHKHGTAYRYDITYYGLDPGKYDLRDYLRRKDGSSKDELPSMPIVVESVLPAGQIEPAPLEVGRIPWVGGYQILLIFAAVLWIAGLILLIFVGRKRRRIDDDAHGEPTRTLADQLRPLVESAVSGKSSPAELASLEQALLAYWRRRLGVQQLSPAAAIAALKNDPGAGELLVQLEAWLHRPGPPANVDVATLLRPYQNLPPELPPLPKEGPR